MIPFSLSRGYYLSDREFLDPANVPILCKSEEDVFAALGMPYIQPNERGLVDMSLLKARK